MTVNKDQAKTISSIKDLYSLANIPIVLCDDHLNCIWENEKTNLTFGKINLDLILSKNNVNQVKELISNNTYGSITATFLPFVGCNINVAPIKNNDFNGVLLMFESVGPNMNKSVDDDSKENERLYTETDNIVSMLSHNLRLPMHLITNAIENLNVDIKRMQDPDKEKIERSISVVENNTYKMCRVCKNLSELIRFSTNTNRFNKSVAKISEYLNSLMSNCAEYVRLAGLNLIYNFSSLPGAPLWILLDREKFELAISNIILNSCQYSNKNKNITVSAVESKESLSIIIEDEGFGIPKDKLEDVFRPYTNFENKYYINKSLGIGLTLTKYIINKHGGTITIDSVEDVGTTVFIDIPIKNNDNNDEHVVRISSSIAFNSKMSTIAIQFSPIR